MEYVIGIIIILALSVAGASFLAIIGRLNDE